VSPSVQIFVLRLKAATSWPSLTVLTFWRCRVLSSSAVNVPNQLNTSFPVESASNKSIIGYLQMTIWNTTLVCTIDNYLTGEAHIYSGQIHVSGCWGGGGGATMPPYTPSLTAASFFCPLDCMKMQAFQPLVMTRKESSKSTSLSCNDARHVWCGVSESILLCLSALCSALLQDCTSVVWSMIFCVSSGSGGSSTWVLAVALPVVAVVGLCLAALALAMCRRRRRRHFNAEILKAVKVAQAAVEIPPLPLVRRIR
jgi:hypothetical protein